MQHGFKTWAEREAAAIRKRLGLRPHDRLPARQLLRDLGALVTRPAAIPDMTAADLRQLTEIDPSAWSAATTSFEGTAIVILNDAHGRERQESTLHHEASHLLRGHKPCELVKVGPFTVREYDKEAEDEAGWLGGCLHLPRPALLATLGAGLGEDVIAERYVASTEMVRYRRRMTGVDRQLTARGRGPGRSISE